MHHFCLLHFPYPFILEEQSIKPIFRKKEISMKLNSQFTNSTSQNNQPLVPCPDFSNIFFFFFFQGILYFSETEHTISLISITTWNKVINNCINILPTKQFTQIKSQVDKLVFRSSPVFCSWQHQYLKSNL